MAKPKSRTQNKAKTSANTNAVGFLTRTKSFFAETKVKLAISLFSFLFAIFLSVAFISFFFTWSSDYSKLNYSWLELITDPAIEVQNWAGKTGAAISKQFIHDWFGIASFSVILILIVFSFKLIRVRLLPFAKTIKYAIILSVWTSIAMGYLFGNYWDANLGGAHGYFMSRWLISFVGSIGTAFFLLLFMFVFVLFAFENSQRWFIKTIRSTGRFSKITNWLSRWLETAKEPVNITINPGKDKTETADTQRQQIVTTEQLDSERNRILAKKEKSGDLTKTEEFILGNDGKKRTVKTKGDLGFEVEHRASEEVSEPDTDSDADNGLALKVQKSEDIEVDELHDIPMGDYDPTLELSQYQVPTIDLLENHQGAPSEVTDEELISNKNRIVETLGNFKIEITKIKAMIGPTITLYEIIPAPGVRISKIKNLEDDIALSLSALGIRIIAPMPGRGTIGIEVPNQKPEIVSMRSVIVSSRFQESKFELPVALGKTISNETYVFDLTKMPHLLVAGATGQGKSVGLNAILASILYKKHPAQVKFVLVDPKKVELTLYEKIEKHFLARLPDHEESIITENQQVLRTLGSLNIEMDTRYELLKDATVRNIKEYNTKFINRRLSPEKGHRYLPYIVVVIDEFADLIMTAGKEVELPIARIAQLARAVGIHLIVATQRPSTNIITGVIKANFPARVAFKVASMIDSRTILDSPGANQLIGRGDMLITEGSELIRLQCAFIDTPELERITDYIGKQRGYPTPHILPDYQSDEPESGDVADLGKRDELFDDAARIVVMSNQGSTSLIQRKLSIGYNRAGRIIDQLEAAGIVGPFEGSKARKVLYADEYSLEQFLDTLN